MKKPLLGAAWRLAQAAGALLLRAAWRLAQVPVVGLARHRSPVRELALLLAGELAREVGVAELGQMP